MGDVTGIETLDVVCDNCSLPESQHIFAGGTRVQNTNHSYICDGYSQKKLLTREQWVKTTKREILETHV
jgi:hypothetical protein